MSKNKKIVGNACRTKTQIRNSKSRGSQMEYDTQYSLEQIGFKVTRTSERGYQRQFDLEAIGESGTTIGEYKVAVECKRLKSMSWNQAVTFFEKLEEVTPTYDAQWLIFKSNNQPALVMHRDVGDIYVTTFETYFGCKFLKHPSTRVKKCKKEE